MTRSNTQSFYSIIDNCKSLPLYDKISSKTKAFIAISRHRWKMKRSFIKREGNDKSKEMDMKNCTCYYFDDVSKSEDFDLDMEMF